MRTKEVTLKSSGRKVTIRRPGFLAAAKISETSIPHELIQAGVADGVDTMDEEAIRKAVVEKFRNADTSVVEALMQNSYMNRVHTVVACLHEPAVTADTIDAEFDIHEFKELEAHIKAHAAEVEENLLPFSKTGSAS